jgi:hypothetical protein
MGCFANKGVLRLPACGLTDQKPRRDGSYIRPFLQNYTQEHWKFLQYY